MDGRSSLIHAAVLQTDKVPYRLLVPSIEQVVEEAVFVSFANSPREAARPPPLRLISFDCHAGGLTPS